MSITDKQLTSIVVEVLEQVLAGRGCWQLTSADVRNVLNEATETVAHRVRDEMEKEGVEKLRGLLSDILATAELIPDPHMGGASDTYLVSLDTIEAARNALLHEGDPHQPIPGIQRNLNRQFVRDEAAKGAEPQ